MLDNTLVLLCGYLLPLAAAWAGVVFMRPMVARARLQREAEAVHDRLIDGILSGQIDADNPRAHDALNYSTFLAERGHELCLSAVLGTEMAARRVGVDLSSRFKERNANVLRVSKDRASDAGNCVIEDAERQLDHIVAWYFVRGTVFWPILVPLQMIVRLRAQQGEKRESSVHVPSVIDQQRPGVLARDMRESARGKSAPPSEFMNHYQPTPRRDLVPA
jgi:hypothetical protein